jgi:hypothetical protein
MFTDLAFRLTKDELIFGLDKIMTMEYILQYPKPNVNWLHMLVEAIKIWWMRKEIRNFKENDLLID